MRKILVLLLATGLVACGTLANQEQWSVVAASVAPFNTGSAALIGGGAPNPQMDFPAEGLRGRWVRLQAFVADAHADIGLVLTAFDGKKRLLRSAPSLCDSLEGPSFCRAYLWVPATATAIKAAVYTNALPSQASQLTLASAGAGDVDSHAQVRWDEVMRGLQDVYFLSAETDWKAMRAATQPVLGAPPGVDPIPQAMMLARELLPRHEHTFVMRSASATPDASSQQGDLPSCEEVSVDTRRLVLPTTLALKEDRLSEYVGAARACLGAAAPSTRWIIDLRGNTGGNMYVMLDAIAPLLSGGALMAFVDPEGTRKTVALQGGAITVEKTVIRKVARVENPTPNAPVLAWIGPSTGSSGEAVAVVLAGRPGVTLVGQPSSGFTTANEVVTLTRDYEIYLTAGWMAFRHGNRVDGPLKPAVLSDTQDAKALLQRMK